MVCRLSSRSPEAKPGQPQPITVAMAELGLGDAEIAEWRSERAARAFGGGL